MASSVDADGPPAPLIRRPKRPNFNYRDRNFDKDNAFKGLGVKEEDVKSTLEQIIKEKHPNFNVRAGVWTSSASLRAGRVRDRVCKAMYKGTPAFCKVPKDYRNFAMTKILSAYTSAMRRRVDVATPRSSLVRNRDSPPTGEAESDSSSAPRSKRPRLEQEPARPTMEADSNFTGYPLRRSVSRVTPVMTRLPTPICGPNLNESMVFFHSVKNGKVGKRLAKIHPVQLQSSHGTTIEWDFLMAEAKAVNDDEGFQFSGCLHLSPRPDQDIPIRTQPTLNSALQDMKTGSLIFTTSAVDLDVKMEDTPATKPLADPSSSQAVPPQLERSIKREGPAPPPSNKVPQQPKTPVQPVTTPNPLAPISEVCLPIDMAWVMEMLIHYQHDEFRPQPAPPTQPAPSTQPARTTRSSTRNKEDGQPDNRDGDSKQSDRKQCTKRVVEDSEDDSGSDADDDDADADESGSDVDDDDADADDNDADADDNDADADESGSDADDDDADADDDDADADDGDADADDDEVDADDDEVDADDDEVHLDEAEGDEEAKNERAAVEATRYALSQPATKTAYSKALREDHTVWDRAGKTFLVGMDQLQNPGQGTRDGRIKLKSQIGLNSRYGLYAHQIPGAVEMFHNIFGPRRSMIQGDEMGYGKSSMVMAVWDMNFRAIAQIHGAQIVPGTDPKRDPLQWPELNNGKLNGCTPRVGALFISASPNGIDVWVKTFVQMFGGDASHRSFADEWKPKLVILHSDGPKLADAFGGADEGIYTSMNHEEWAELLPLPDWSRARIAHGEQTYPGVPRQAWVGPSRWQPHPSATATEPSPTSTRYIIISTNQSWKTNVGFILGDEDMGNDLKSLNKELDALPLQHTKKRALKAREISQLKAAKLSSLLGSRWGTDGTQPMQATRQSRYDTGNNHMVTATEVVDLRYASWVAVDEMHSAASGETITYRQIISPTIIGCGPTKTPGILGITGTALYNGAALVMTFAQKVCLQVADGESDDPGVVALLSVKHVDFASVWKSIYDVYRKGSVTAGERSEKLNRLSRIASFHKAFATMLEFYLIARDSNSKNPWGKLLTILNVKLDVRYVDVEHSAEMWKHIKDAQDKVQAFQLNMHKEHLQAWADLGSPPDQRPLMPNLALANPNSYLVARTVSCFPNLLNAIENWQREHPDQPQVFDDPNDICLGNKNDVVKSALKSNDCIKQSFIWDIAQEACVGAKKVEMVVQEIEDLGKQTTGATVTTNTGQKQVHYRSKFMVAVGMRFARALLWAYLSQRFTPERVVGVSDKKSRVSELPKWQRYWDSGKQQVDDGVDILVAGLKVVSQSVTLIEGHVIYGFDPPTNNNDEKQLPKRQHRIGQTHDCRVVWLVTVNPAALSKNATKKTDKSKGKKTIESDIVQRNKGKTDFFMDMRDLEVTASTAVVDLTGSAEEETV